MKSWLDKNADPLQDMFTGQNLKYKYISCPLCESNREKQRYFISSCSYRVVQCQSCRFIYENPQPTSDSIYSLYHDTSYFNLIIKHTSDNLRTMKLNLRDINFEDYEKGILDLEMRVLDVGCASGAFLEYMQSRGWSCYGIEPGDPAFEIASKNKDLTVFHNELLDANFESNFFHFVQLNNVIEHTRNPLEVLQECYRILKSNGLLLLATPDYGSISRLFWDSAWRDFVAIHLCLFSKKILRRTLEQIGFRIEKETSWGGGFVAGQIPLWLRKFIDRLTKKFNIGDHILVAAIKH